MKKRRIIGLSVVATAAIWFQVAGSFEARRIDQQRESRPVAQARQVGLRIDSERLMAAVTALADPKFEGRAAGSPGGLAARAWIVDRYKSIGVHPVSGAYVHPFTYKRMSMSGPQEGEGANLLGMCIGSDPKLPFFVVSAHYDHLGVRDGQIYPGADDDASGVAVVLELAAFCQKTPFRHSVVFAAFDAEERGLQGARAFFVKPPVPQDRIALNVNLDMVSRNDKREIFIAGTYHYPDLKEAARGNCGEGADHGAVRSRQAGDRRRRRRGLDQPVGSRPLPRREDPVRVFRRRRSRRLPQADRYGRQDRPGFFRRRRGNDPRRGDCARSSEVSMEQQLFDAIKAGQVDEVRQLSREIRRWRSA